MLVSDDFSIGRFGDPAIQVQLPATTEVLPSVLLMERSELWVIVSSSVALLLPAVSVTPAGAVTVAVLIR